MQKKKFSWEREEESKKEEKNAIPEKSTLTRVS